MLFKTKEVQKSRRYRLPKLSAEDVLAIWTILAAGQDKADKDLKKRSLFSRMKWPVALAGLFGGAWLAFQKFLHGRDQQAHKSSYIPPTPVNAPAHNDDLKDLDDHTVAESFPASDPPGNY